MSEENVDEVVTIAILSNEDESVRTITNEFEQSNTCWPHLVQVFLEQLQGLGYRFACDPEEMAGVLDEYHMQKFWEKENTENPPVEEIKKEEPKQEYVGYPYTGTLLYDGEDGGKELVVVKFIASKYGEVVYSHCPHWRIGETSAEWNEDSFVRINK